MTETIDKEIIAYKALRLNSDGILCSIFSHDQWPGNAAIEAKPFTPDARRNRGIETYTNPKVLLGYFRENHYAEIPNPILVEVNVWGEASKHEEGYRSQFVSIKAIHLRKDDENLDHRLVCFRRNYPKTPIFVDGKRIELPEIIYDGLGRVFL